MKFILLIVKFNPQKFQLPLADKIFLALWSQKNKNNFSKVLFARCCSARIVIPAKWLLRWVYNVIFFQNTHSLPFCVGRMIKGMWNNQKTKKKKDSLFLDKHAQKKSWRKAWKFEDMTDAEGTIFYSIFLNNMLYFYEKLGIQDFFR